MGRGESVVTGGRNLREKTIKALFIVSKTSKSTGKRRGLAGGGRELVILFGKK